MIMEVAQIKMVMMMSLKEDAKINSNTFGLVIEALLESNKWKESLLLVRAMDKLGFQPSLNVCVTLVEVLERAKQYRAVLAVYRYMESKGYDFYENSILNGIFKRLVQAPPPRTKADLVVTAPLDAFLADAKV